MKFWITIIVGAIVVTVVSTALYVYNPDLRQPRSSEPAAAQPEKSQMLPRAVADVMEKKEGNVPQMYKGKTVFEIRNEGDGDLVLKPDRPNCTCAGLELTKVQNPGAKPVFVKLIHDEETKGWSLEASRGIDDSIRLAKGEKAQLTVEWDSKLRSGEVTVAAPIETNDAQSRLNFRVILDVKNDLLLSANVVEFGTLVEGKKAEQTLYIYSTIRDDVEVREPVVSTKSISVKFVPLTDEEKAKLTAKSGVKAIIASDGALPVGQFFEKLDFATNLPRTPNKTVHLTGEVEGKIETQPGKRLDFNVVTASGERAARLTIFARGLAADEVLSVAEFEPKFLKIELERKYKTMWVLKGHVPADAPPGRFHGNISIVDNKGVKRLNIPVQGIVSGVAAPTGS